MLCSTRSPKRPSQPPRNASLSRGRKNAPSETLVKFSNIMKDKLLDIAVDTVIAARKESTNGRIQRDTMAVILKGLPSGCTRDMIYNREKKRRRVEEKCLDTTKDVPELVPALRNKGGRPLEATYEAAPELVPALRNKVGRPFGATNKAVPEFVPALHNKGGQSLGATNEDKRDREEREQKAKADAVQALLARWAVREPGKRSKKNELKLIIEAAKKKFNVEDLSIPESMIRDRATTGNVNPTTTGRVSPMAEVEPLLVSFVICLQRIGQPLNQTTFLELANSLIKGTPFEEKVLASKHGGIIGKANGIRYYTLFMKRHKDEIDSRCRGRLPADRTKWTTYQTIESMYDMVYAVLVEAGVASRTDSPQWSDKSGHPVATIEADASFGTLIVGFILDHTRKFRSDYGLHSHSSRHHDA
jgi:hypothetical protein